MKALNALQLKYKSVAATEVQESVAATEVQKSMSTTKVQKRQRTDAP